MNRVSSFLHREINESFKMNFLPKSPAFAFVRQNIKRRCACHSFWRLRLESVWCEFATETTAGRISHPPTLSHQCELEGKNKRILWLLTFYEGLIAFFYYLWEDFELWKDRWVEWSRPRFDFSPPTKNPFRVSSPNALPLEKEGK